MGTESLQRRCVVFQLNFQLLWQLPEKLRRYTPGLWGLASCVTDLTATKSCKVQQCFLYQNLIINNCKLHCLMSLWKYFVIIQIEMTMEDLDYASHRYIHHELLSVRGVQESARRRKGNPVPGGITGTSCPWGYKYGNLALQVGESRIRDSKIWSWVPRDSDPRITTLARASSNCKRKIHSLVKDDVT
jgi:hypothetical protein